MGSAFGVSVVGRQELATTTDFGNYVILVNETRPAQYRRAGLFNIELVGDNGNGVPVEYESYPMWYGGVLRKVPDQIGGGGLQVRYTAYWQRAGIVWSLYWGVT